MSVRGTTGVYGAHFRLPRRIVNRNEFILQHCAGRRVLHLGCVDYSSTGDWPGAVPSEHWLHAKISLVAADLVGLDSSEEGVKLLAERFHIRQVYLADVQDLGSPRLGKFDVVVAGEILEHLPNPGLFLAAVRPWMADDGELIVTTINAYCIRRLLRVLVGIESVHQDHVAYYSHRTLCRLGERYRFRTVEQCAYRLSNRRPFGPYLFERLASILSPDVCEGVIARLVAVPPPNDMAEPQHCA